MKEKSESDFIMKEEESHKKSSTSLPKNKNLNASDVPTKYKLYFIRWVIWVFFTTSIAASGLAMVGMSAITPIITGVYGVSSLTTTMLILPFVILFIPLIFPANYLINNYGISIPVYIASVTLIIGAWIRMFVNSHFSFLIAGQVVMAMGQPFVLSTPAKLAGVWFGDKERAIATTLGSLAAPIGAVIGYLLPLPIISDKDIDPKSHGQKQFLKYILIQNIVITCLGIPIIFFIRNNPPTPPSASAENVMKNQSTGQLKSI